ncbi:MAG: isochorismatase family cysteine hydrolase [Eubacteriales bacterium]|nr:isochorismatase family cysteine hydrolase [Eubacteriales bacterium]
MDLLIVVDMQNDFINGSLGTAEAKKILSRVQDEVEKFKGIVLYTRDTHDSTYLETQEGKNLPVPHCIRGSEGWQIAPAVYRENAEIIDKDSFGSLKLAQRVQELDAKEKLESITIIGLCTDICVISNALILKAALPEVELRVISDCCAGVSPESHNNALKAMAACQVKII